jgi:hypothetical protein
VSHASWLQLGLYAIILFALHVSVGIQTLFSSYRMIRRLRWLLLSILILSLWFTPGEAIFEAYTKWSPSWEGLEFGLLRVAILAEIVMAVNILLITTKTEELIAALQWLLRPMSWLGIKNDKLALRIAMTLEAVKNPFIDMTQLVASSGGRSVWRRISYVVFQAYRMTLEDNAEVRGQDIHLKQIGQPAIIEWLWLPAIMIVYYTPMMVF